jgi:hypothetical protein
VHQLAPPKGDEDQHLQRLERQRGYGEQIGRPQMVGMVAQECATGPCWRAAWSSSAIASNRAVADSNAELEQFASDALGAPQSGSRGTWS